ncbi:MAG TPA: hypothetical protein VJG90_02105 [Candidatus Nanoarchaeia archaeon]|nr:hypothetical protein [Candidatus Nanoarchaeia archaeon]
MKAQTLITIALVVLVVVYGVQTMQLMNIKEQVAGGTIQVSSTNTPTQGGQAAVPQNLQNLPDMVGGC